MESINEDFKYAIMYKNKSKLTINYKILDSICFSSNINYLNLTFGYNDIFVLIVLILQQHAYILK